MSDRRRRSLWWPGREHTRSLLVVVAWAGVGLLVSLAGFAIATWIWGGKDGLLHPKALLPQPRSIWPE
jgi:hypothetical protein